MKNVDFKSTNTKMYFIDVSSEYHNFDSCGFINKYRNFYINDIGLIKAFNNELRKKRTLTNYSNTSCYYGLQIIQNDEIKYGAYLDVKNKQLIESNNYEFDLDHFESFKENFRKLEAHEIDCKSLNHTKKLLSEFESEGVYIYKIEYFRKMRIFEFNGVVTLNCSNFDHSLTEWKDIEKSIKNDFSKIDQIEILSFSSFVSDSVKMDLLCTKDISEELPFGYEIEERYRDSISLPFKLYDIEEADIKNIIKKCDLKNIDIVDLNE